MADHSDLLRVRRTAIHDDEVTRIAGLPVTTLSRTVTRLARTSPFDGVSRWWTPPWVAVSNATFSKMSCTGIPGFTG